MDSVQTTDTTTTQTSTTSASADITEEVNSDYDLFLQLLTAQAQYQDPLGPMSNTEYAAQLAQFSAVEQQVNTNEYLALITDQLAVTGLTEYAGWIGLDARSTVPSYFDGDAIEIAPGADDDADAATLVVYDDAGTEVQRLDLPLESETVLWGGTDEEGNTLATGYYTFEVESRSNGELLSTRQAETLTRITEASLSDGTALFVLDGGTVVTTEDILGLRDPG